MRNMTLVALTAFLVCGCSAKATQSKAPAHEQKFVTTYDAYAKNIAIAFVGSETPSERFANAVYAVEVDWIEADGARYERRRIDPYYLDVLSMSHVMVGGVEEPMIYVIQSGVFYERRSDVWTFAFSSTTAPHSGFDFFEIPLKSKVLRVRYRIRYPDGPPSEWRILEGRAIPFLKDRQAEKEASRGKDGDGTGE